MNLTLHTWQGLHRLRLMGWLATFSALGCWPVTAAAQYGAPESKALTSPAKLDSVERGSPEAKMPAQESSADSTPSGAPRLIRVIPPRDNGYMLGDVVSYRALVSWPEGWTIDRDGLPPEVRHDAPIELRDESSVAAPEECGDCRWLDLRWQVFQAVHLTQDVSLPATPVRFRRGTEFSTINLPAAVLAVSPQIPWERRKEWLDSIRPSVTPLPINTRPFWIEGYAALGLGALALFGWGWTSGRWFAGSRERPFATAWRQVRSRRGTEASDADDLRQWHRAFDATAGETVFGERLDQFFTRYPQFAPLAEDVRSVFETSRRTFFTDTGSSGPALRRDTLVRVLRRLADAEFQFWRPSTRPDSTATNSSAGTSGARPRASESREKSNAAV